MRNLFNDVNENVYSIIGQNGAKNLIPFPYYRPNHYETAGITYDVSSNGIITMQTGTSTAEADYHMWNRNADASLHLDEGTYILSGRDINAPNTVSIILNGKDKNGNNKNVIVQNSQYPTGVEFTIDDTYDLDRFGVLIYCGSDVTISSALTFKPMIRLAEDTDNTYQPYAKTNRQLTEESVNKKTTVDSFYGTCDTAAATAAKVITVVDTENNFSLRPGVLVTVKFDNVNTANNPTFNVNNTGAKSVSYNNAVVSTDSLWAGGDSAPSLYVYDGTNWVLLAYSSYSTAQSVIVNPSSAPTGDGSIWIETT